MRADVIGGLHNLGQRCPGVSLSLPWRRDTRHPLPPLQRGVALTLEYYFTKLWMVVRPLNPLSA